MAARLPHSSASRSMSTAKICREIVERFVSKIRTEEGGEIRRPDLPTMGDANKNLAQQGDANRNPAHQGLPPRHLIIPYSVAAAMANRPIRLASQARLLSGGGRAAAQHPLTQHAIAAQRRLPIRNPWSRIVPSLLPDGRSYHIIDTSFTSEEAFVPAPPPLLLVSAARHPVELSVLTTGRYRFGYGFGSESSSSTALRTPAAPTTMRGPTLLFLPAPPVHAPLVPAPPALAPPLVVPHGRWTVSPTTGNDRFGDGGASSSTAVPLTPAGHSTPPEPVPSVPVPLGLTMSPITAHYSFSYGGASSSSATPLPTPLAPAPPADVPPGFTVSPTITPYSFGYDRASSSSATPRVHTTSLALHAPAPHLHVPRAPAPPVLAPLAHTPPIPTLPALAPPADVPPGFTVSLTTTRYSFGYGGASSSFAMPHAATAPLALRAPAPHLRVSRKPRPLVPTPPALAPPVATPPTPATPVPTPPVTAPPTDVLPGFTVSPTTTHYSFGYGGASLSSAMPRVATAPLALRGPAPHLRMSRMLAPPIPMTPAPTLPAPPVTTPPATAPSMAAPAAALHGFGYSGVSSPSVVPCTSSVPLALHALAPHLRALHVSVPRPRALSTSAPPAAAPRGWTVSLTTGRYSLGDSGASSSSTTPCTPTTPLALHAPGPHLCVPPVAAPLPTTPRGWTMPPTTGRYRFSYGGVSLSYATPRAPIAPLALRSPAPQLRSRRMPTAPPAAATPRVPTPPAAAAAPAAPPAPPSSLPSWPVQVRPPSGPARARLAPAAPAEAFEEYLVQHRAIEATVDDTPWEMIGRSRKTGGPMFAVAGGGRDRAELEAMEARERCKNRMHKRKATAAAPAQQPPPPPPPPPADAPGSSGGGSKKRGGGRKKKKA
uniref:Uncharacterized protein n=1 Tax=Oryza meridionalis TaxID=40149 RepID=A0A0E0EFS4_9ORYZ